MEISMRYVLTGVVYVKCLLGLTVNLIIVAANFMKWKSLKSPQTCDKILSSLAISRVLCFFTVFLWNFIYNFFPWLKKIHIVLLTINIQIVFVSYSSHWIATILCIFYCVKIVTYNYRLFVFLKTRISTMVPWLILASLLMSLLSSLPLGWYAYDLNLQNLLNCSTENVTDYGLVMVPNFDNRFLIFSVGSFPPFMIFCVANFLLIHFLLMHTRRMRSNGSHIQGPKLESHFSALKGLTVLLLLQIMFFICMSLFSSGNYFQLKLSILIGWITFCIPPLFHSLYMIFSSSEIRKVFVLKDLWPNRSS